MLNRIKSRFRRWLDGEEKWRAYAVLVAGVVVLGVLVSLLANLALIRDDEATRPRLAIVTSPDSEATQAIAKGARAFVQHINRSGGLQGRQVDIWELSETEQASQVLKNDPRLIGVVGFQNSERAAEAALALKPRQVVVATGSLANEGQSEATHLAVDPVDEARFIGNYARNILQQRLMYVIRQKSEIHSRAASAFEEVYRRFETPVRGSWEIDPTIPLGPQLEKPLKAIGEFGIGGVFIAADPAVSASLLKALRQSGNSLDLFGTSSMSTTEFKRALTIAAGADTASMIHGLVVTAPVVFDVTNDQGQRFKFKHESAYGEPPDWRSALGYDAAQLVLRKSAGQEAVTIVATQEATQGRFQLPIRVGNYSGEQLVSAPIQLQPIARGSNFNYIEALRQGRVLYVNDRFMFRTNVVYVGTAFHDVSKVDTGDETAVLDFSIWFRYRGKFSPQDIVFSNAVDPIKLEKPEESKEIDGVQYRRFRVKHKFKLNFDSQPRQFGEHVAGISFRHRQLNYNNIQYVTDVLGMPSGAQLKKDIEFRQVVKASTGWQVDGASMSQGIIRERGDGELQYIGMTGEQPFFSTVDATMRLRSVNAQARDYISPEYFLYIGIFGLMGGMFASMVERRRWTRFYELQGWLLRVTFWPLALLAVGNLLLDFGYQTLTPANIRAASIVYDSAWWIMGAVLADMAVRRFFWVPLEARTERIVPKVMKFLVSALMFLVVVMGITAFVLNLSVTNLLATSGVLVMVIGLAIKANIANIFSGIILNVERPFRVGDYVKVNNIVGKVIDINWRTTTIEASGGHMVSIANSKVSDSTMENLSNTPNGIDAETLFFTAPDVDPVRVIAVIKQALADSKAVINKDKPGFEPGVRFNGVVNHGGQWVAQYKAGYRVATAPKKAKASEELWTEVRSRFIEEGIALVPVPAVMLGSADTRTLPTPRAGI